jgi:CspA family cold shock protein
MERGTIKWFDEQKGYGFILSDTDGKEYFVHATAVTDMGRVLEKGEHVEFEVVEGKKGPQAGNVRSLSESEAE